jgi:hypothetical protein
VGIDTEARRMLQYADEFKFEYLEFGEPFSSTRYAEAMKAAAEEAQGGCVIVDSMSHEHEGMGGYLDFHEKEVQRLIKDGGFRNEFAAAIPAWNKPSQERRKLINVMLQLNCSFVFCFRAKEKIKPVKGGTPLELGWQAIAGEEFGFEMTVRCLLTPGSKGVPNWSDAAQRLGVPKRIKDHEAILKDGEQLDERAGELLSAWAAGSTKPRPTESAPTQEPESERAGQQPPPAPAADQDDGLRDPLVINAREWAECGTEKYANFWTGLTADQRKHIGATRHESFKKIAASAV